MLKWIAQRGNNPRSASPTRSNKTPNSSTDITSSSGGSSPWLYTDDPLATINVNTILDTKRKSAASRRQSELNPVYSVTRMNPLFVDSPSTAKDMATTTNLTDGEKRLMDESRSSNRSEQCQTPSSSGYESAAADPRLGNNSSNTTATSNHKHQQQQQQQQHQSVHNHRHHRHHQQHLVELSPASDYRRQFVLGPRLDRSSPRKMTPDVAAAAAAAVATAADADGLIPSRRIGKANLLHHNSLYVTRIHMPSSVGGGGVGGVGCEAPTNQKTTTDVSHDEWDKYEQEQEENWDGLNLYKKIPHPVWPANPGGNCIQLRNNATTTTTTNSAIVQQNENYVTKILIAPRLVDKKKTSQGEETLDSIVTHSLLVMTSYDGKSIDDDNDDDEDPSEKKENERIETPPAELSEIRQLSQTISQSRVVATVSRALSKSSRGSTASSSSETAYPTTPTTNAESSSSSSSSSVGGSIARRISMMKERWDKSSRRRLLTESDDDDTALNRRLDHVYVPQNGDVNFSMGQLNSRSNNNNSAPVAPGEPFSYLAGVYHPATINEEVTANESQLRAVIVASRPHNHYDPFEQDRLSNSSSRSSGSRRVTFSADTVDNEQSNKSTTNSIASSSSGSTAGSTVSDKSSSNHCPNIMEELKLNPHYLPHRYQPSVSSVVDVVGSSRLAGYYSYNLQAQLDNYNSAKGQGEKVSTWEHYHHQDVSSKVPGSLTGRPSSSAGVVRLDPYNNLQLHPNYGAACQERSICVDFTLDGVEEALLQRRSDSHKIRRRICCCLLLLLCLVVLVIVVIVISLYLSQGQKIFGSLGPM